MEKNVTIRTFKKLASELSGKFLPGLMTAEDDDRIHGLLSCLLNDEEAPCHAHLMLQTDFDIIKTHLRASMYSRQKISDLRSIAKYNSKLGALQVVIDEYTPPGYVSVSLHGPWSVAYIKQALP
jgi:hypothetical protein